MKADTSGTGNAPGYTGSYPEDLQKERKTMKRKTSFILTLILVFLSVLSGPANAAKATPTFVWEDCAVQLLHYKIAVVYGKRVIS